MGGTVDILMYHAIEDAPGPTSIAPHVFAAQMDALAESAVPVLPMDDVADHLAKGSGHRVAITFDDGFQNFADIAFPVLKRHGFASMVYLPTEHIGGSENWKGCNTPPRALMGWDAIRTLSRNGVDFGNHTARHLNLNTLQPDAIAAEIDAASTKIHDELGQKPLHFAPPYGSGMPMILPILRPRFATSVSTALDRADETHTPCALPRIEMFYFTDIVRWRQHLAGQGHAYLKRRKLLRQVRQLLPI